MSNTGHPGRIRPPSLRPPPKEGLIFKMANVSSKSLGVFPPPPMYRRGVSNAKRWSN